MDVNAGDAAAITDFERAHLELSFKRSLVALAVAVGISLFWFSPLWVLAVYGLAFCLGRRTGFAVKAAAPGGPERAAARALAWHDMRPVLSIVAPFAVVLFLADAMKAFSAWFEARRDTALLADEALTGLSEAFAVVSGWDHPWFAIAVLTTGSLALASGLTDGLWVGAVQSRTGVRVWRTVPLGREWADWRGARRERRRLYLGGSG